MLQINPYVGLFVCREPDNATAAPPVVFGELESALYKRCGLSQPTLPQAICHANIALLLSCR